MHVSDVQTIEQAQKPWGITTALDPCPEFLTVSEYDPYKKMYWYTTKESQTHIYADDDKTIIKRTSCRNCHKNIRHYKNVYYKKVFELGRWYSYEHSEKQSYCEECAIKLTKEVWTSNFQVAPLDYIEIEAVNANFETREIKHFSDGSILEEMTAQEKARQIIR